MIASNRIIFNTCVMYARVCITMVVTLLSSRWILMALGKEDFGIFNLVAGLLGFLMFLNVSMSIATQRFLSFYLVKDGARNIEEMFYISCVLHFFVGVLVLLIIEFGGLIMLNTVLSVPDGKLHLAIIVLHILSVSTFFTIISVPYNAILLAHENMIFVAIINITESVLKLITAMCLLNYSGERLTLYAFYMMGIQICSTLIYRLYCNRHYKETKFNIHIIKNVNLLKEMLYYVWWNMIGSISNMCRTQGVSMLLNSFFGVVINAAYGIATQVNGQLTFFSSTIVSAARPQIVKSEGEGNRKRMLELTNSTCKITFLMLSMLTIPLIVEMSYILTLWLKNVPEYTVMFTRLILILSLVFQFSTGISIGIESVGKIKNVQIFVGGMHFLVLPVGYIMLINGMEPYTIFIMIIIEEIIGLFLRLFFSHRITGLNVYGFINRILIPSIITFIGVYLMCHFVKWSLSENFLRLILTFLTSIFTMSTLCFIYTLSKKEKETLIRMFVTAKSKFF